MWFALRALVVVILVGWTTQVVASPHLKDDEDVLLFPGLAHRTPDGGGWEMEIHGWTFEREEDSRYRTVLTRQIAAAMGFAKAEAESPLLASRLRMFVVDNERNKKVTVAIGDRTFALDASGPNGHFTGTIRLADAELGGLADASWVPFRLVLGSGSRRPVDGLCRLLEAQGISVVSDIDDTIKHSHVLDRRELLANTFVRPFAPVPGMSAAYRAWAAAGASFHYVSGSPWQLYPPLADLLEREDFPRGSFSLKLVRFKDTSVLNLFASPLEFKIGHIDRLFQRYPHRRFILVGDSGEQDPEVYGHFGRTYPDRVVHIFIREAPGRTYDAARFDEAFAGLPTDRWTVFQDPAVLQRFAPPAR